MKKPDLISIYDTTLRDGTQRRGISVTVDDKIKVTKLLDTFGVHYIEGGWPGSNPKDALFFDRAKQLRLQTAKLVAFGSTRRAGIRTQLDLNLQALLSAETRAVALVGKASAFHVTEILGCSLEENLEMIYESVEFITRNGREVIFDAEHFFDGYRESPEYALKTLEAAAKGGAAWLVLCDTNGGSLPQQISDAVRVASAQLPVPIGIHTHNDSELAVANSLAAISAGARQVQGTVNGYGERCGNANLVPIIANLQLKLGYRCLVPEKLAQLTTLSRTVAEILNVNPDQYAAYVGAAAFAHKGGLHVAAVQKHPKSYEHISPELVGNRRDAVVSELSGRGNIRVKMQELKIGFAIDERQMLEQIKTLESQGYQFENADGTFELLLRKADTAYTAPFNVTDMTVVVSERVGQMTVEAVLKGSVADEEFHVAADGNGPLHALDRALRKALLLHYPELSAVQLIDFKVRILSPENATGAVTRVSIDATDGKSTWTTIGCSANIVEASYQALQETYELFILRSRDRRSLSAASGY